MIIDLDRVQVALNLGVKLKNFYSCKICSKYNIIDVNNRLVSLMG